MYNINSISIWESSIKKSGRSILRRFSQERRNLNCGSRVLTGARAIPLFWKNGIRTRRHIPAESRKSSRPTSLKPKARHSGRRRIQINTDFRSSNLSRKVKIKGRSQAVDERLQGGRVHVITGLC